MTKMNAKLVLMGLALASMALASPALAGPKNGAKGKGETHPAQHEERHEERYQERHEERHGDDDKITIRIGDDDRIVIGNYYRDDYRRNCPPGLAKKNNGCQPPGQAKKYRIGEVYDGPYGPLPDYLKDKLHAPKGYEYIQVDKDIVLIGEATKKVIDAVTLISAVGD